jgi:hypothetical protein
MRRPARREDETIRAMSLLGAILAGTIALDDSGSIHVIAMAICLVFVGLHVWSLK